MAVFDFGDKTYKIRAYIVSDNDWVDMAMGRDYVYYNSTPVYPATCVRCSEPELPDGHGPEVVKWVSWLLTSRDLMTEELAKVLSDFQGALTSPDSDKD